MDHAWLPNLFLNKESSDVQLHIKTTAGESEAVIPAHSIVLRLVSKVFRTMLDSPNFMEGRTGKMAIKVKGNIDDAIFFLRYLYTKELEHVDLEVYVSVLQAAHMYQVDDLFELCNERIVRLLTGLTVCRTYPSLKNVASKELLTHCKDLMLDFAFLIFRKNLHLSLDEEIMAFLLSSTRLNVLDEEQALGALWRWGCARQACEKDAEQQFKTLLSFINISLVDNVPKNSYYYRFWKNVKLEKELRDSSQPFESNLLTRQPNLKSSLVRFAEICCFYDDTANLQNIHLSANNNCIIGFSVDREILLVGFTIQVTTVLQMYTCTNNIVLHINSVPILQSISSKEVLVYKFKNIVECYVCDVTIDLHKPLLMKKSVFNILTMDFNLLKPPSLTARTFTNNFIVNRDFTLYFRGHDDRIAVSRLYYFV